MVWEYGLFFGPSLHGALSWGNTVAFLYPQDALCQNGGPWPSVTSSIFHPIKHVAKCPHVATPTVILPSTSHSTRSAPLRTGDHCPPPVLVSIESHCLDFPTILSILCPSLSPISVLTPQDWGPPGLRTSPSLSPSPPYMTPSSSIVFNTVWKLMIPTFVSLATQLWPPHSQTQRFTWHPNLTCSKLNAYIPPHTCPSWFP